MKTDRELLALAAKAAGLNIAEWTNDYDTGCFGHPDNGGEGFIIHSQVAGSELWNPLENDGDALRLAVKLGMMIDLTANHAMVSKTGEYEHRLDKWFSERFGEDANSATRRAIVRAAAAIGEAMQ